MRPRRRLCAVSSDFPPGCGATRWGWISWVGCWSSTIAPRRMIETQPGFTVSIWYGLYRSISEIIKYLEGVDPVAAERARERYACFDHFGGEGQNYGYAAAFGAGESCEQEVIDQL